MRTILSWTVINNPITIRHFFLSKKYTQKIVYCFEEDFFFWKLNIFYGSHELNTFIKNSTMYYVVHVCRLISIWHIIIIIYHVFSVLVLSQLRCSISKILFFIFCFSIFPMLVCASDKKEKAEALFRNIDWLIITYLILYHDASVRSPKLKKCLAYWECDGIWFRWIFGFYRIF